MINEKKLLCAFILSAYESNYCGRHLSLQTLSKHKCLYASYIADEKSGYPLKEIESSQEIMMTEIKSSGIRDYIYNQHLTVIVKRIEEETGKPINLLSRERNIALLPYLNCPANFYKVLGVNHNKVLVSYLLMPGTKELTILEGLETPVVEDIVSGHWNHLLEVLTSWDQLDKYLEFSRKHINALKIKKPYSRE